MPVPQASRLPAFSQTVESATILVTKISRPEHPVSKIRADGMARTLVRSTARAGLGKP